MTEVGDKGIVMDTFGDKVFVPLADTLNVGDSVAVYNLVDDTRIAVPILAFDIGDFAFATPSFDFAGFDWKLDFDFNLIPLMLGFPENSLVAGMFCNYMNNNENPSSGMPIWGNLGTNQWSGQGAVISTTTCEYGGEFRILWIDGSPPLYDAFCEIKHIGGGDIMFWIGSNNLHGAHHIWFRGELIESSPVGPPWGSFNPVDSYVRAYR